MNSMMVTVGIGGALLIASMTATGCGTTISPDALDAAPVDAETIDADLSPCDLGAPFGNIQPVGGINTAAADEFVSLSPDEHTIYVSNNVAAPGTPNLGLYVGSRSSVDDPFGALVALVNVNTDADDRSPSVASDGLSVLFHSSRGASYDVYVSTRTSTSDAFAAAVALGAGVNTAAIETGPTVSADGETLYFNREAEIMRSVLGPTGFGTATPVAELNSGATASPVFTPDELTVFWASDRAGGSGLFDIWTATRLTALVPFTGIANVTELNTDVQEFPDWVSPDGCRLYFTSQKPGGAGDFDVYVAERP